MVVSTLSSSKSTNSSIQVSPAAFQAARQNVVRQLSRGAAMESYARAYFPYCVQLHMITEIEQFWNSRLASLAHDLSLASQARMSHSTSVSSSLPSTSSSSSSSSYLSSLSSSASMVLDLQTIGWDERLSRTQNSFRVREPILSLRRVLYSINEQCCLNKLQQISTASQSQLGSFSSSAQHAQLSALSSAASDSRRHVGTLWLQLAEMAHNTSQFQASAAALAHAARANVPGHRVQLAKLLRTKGEVHKAIALLQAEVDATASMTTSASRHHIAAAEENKFQMRKRGKALLLMAQWNEEVGIKDGVNTVDQIQGFYQVAIACEPAEKPFYLYAKYLDHMHRAMLTEIICGTSANDVSAAQTSSSSSSSSPSPSSSSAHTSASSLLLNFTSEQNATLILRCTDRTKLERVMKLFAECLRSYGNSLVRLINSQFRFSSSIVNGTFLGAFNFQPLHASLHCRTRPPGTGTSLNRCRVCLRSGLSTTTWHLL